MEDLEKKELKEQSAVTNEETAPAEESGFLSDSEDVVTKSDSVEEETQNSENKEEKDGSDGSSSENSDITHEAHEKKNSKGLLIGLIAAVAALAIAGVVLLSSNANLKTQVADSDALTEETQEELTKANEKIKELESQIKELEAQVDELENGAAAQLVEIKNAFDSGDWNKVVSLADALHKNYNGSPEDVEAQKLVEQAKQKIEEEKAAKAAEEAKGYETGITYDQLARTPDDYEGSKVKFTGKVLQVIEGDDSVQLRLAVNSNYDNVLFLEYDKSIVSSRILEDDIITIYGVSVGTITYESTMGGNITIPAVLVKKIDQ